MLIGWMLGFRKAFYQESSVDNDDCNDEDDDDDEEEEEVVSNIFYAEALVDLNPLKYIFLSVDDYNNNVNKTFDSAFNESILNNNVLARINNSTPPMPSQIITTPREYFGPVNINAIQIQLLNSFGQVIHSLSADYSFCLAFQIIYDI